jgi:hypothetical protein
MVLLMLFTDLVARNRVSRGVSRRPNVFACRAWPRERRSVLAGSGERTSHPIAGVTPLSNTVDPRSATGQTTPNDPYALPRRALWRASFVAAPTASARPELSQSS